MWALPIRLAAQLTHGDVCRRHPVGMGCSDLEVVEPVGHVSEVEAALDDTYLEDACSCSLWSNPSLSSARARLDA